MQLQPHRAQTGMTGSLDPSDNESPELFARARGMAAALPLSFCSTIVLDGNCRAEPPCHHCRWRSSTTFAEKFRRIPAAEEVANRAIAIEQAGISRVLLLSGWMGPEVPPYFYDDIRAIKDSTHLETCGGFGYTGKASLSLLKSAGLDSYFCGLEMPNRSLFKEVRPGDDFDARLDTIRYAKEYGLKVWSGFIFGAGETASDIDYALNMFDELAVDSLYLNPLVPSPNTEMEDAPPPDLLEWSKLLAEVRIKFPGLDMFTKPEFAPLAFQSGANAYIHAPAETSAIAKLKEIAMQNRIKGGV
jgi:biotin synthase-like enzyme